MNIGFYNLNNNMVNFSGRSVVPRFFVNKEKLEECFVKGMSTAEIAELYGVKPYKVYELTRIFKINRAELSKKARLESDKSQLNSLLPPLLEKGMSTREISKKLSVNRSKIEKWIKANVPEGLINFKRERLVNLLNSGLSDEEIAEIRGISPNTARLMRARFMIWQKNVDKNKK